MKKPLISIFSTPNGKYFYDACLCRMEEVSDARWITCRWISGTSSELIYFDKWQSKRQGIKYVAYFL